MYRAFENGCVYLECIVCHKMVNIGAIADVQAMVQRNGPIYELVCDDCAKTKQKEDK